MQPIVKTFFDEPTFTFSHVVSDSETKECAIIDSVLDFDYASGKTDRVSADQIITYIKEEGLQTKWILETHVHADHLSAAPYLKDQLGGTLAIGDHITVVQDVFGKAFNAGTEFERDGSQFDHLFKDDESFNIGSIAAKAIHTPGHTPACMSYLIGDALFVGDTLFMPDYGTARCDFPGGDATTLYQSIQKLFTLPDETRVFMCHDYKAPGRDEYQFETTIGEERQHNIHVSVEHDQADFIQMRESRDATLDMPRLILPSVQVNMRAGHLPPAEDNGQRYLKIPVDLF
ncbi:MULTISPECIES: MBL fold metallo-hydrolase [unclassified Marinobacterium]|uniref:MBL fold metallo-hydrolase n=1 Tax=unclassified Marinobacterium TaxID=2644139 RepID=UPI0015693EFA|nr:MULTISPECIES: MBL fold metallo-hydrolase [unclassified Marinobacterium]NRP15744.1 putative metallo-hydrolase [Marinobacterium sp. xm-a-152]NRP27564.1 putative metallo-hydrolase [Marinobacterium sp. xm-d-420]NRP36077.1 putative metallo-hydrolase [Marinobacterium sp. xm-d-579]NRP38855.1 putative metallo-hydrolase [Marinobacterium sp. xm-a-121]NRP47897.1 putative metallo-hydrolase [Marinobacterium sp. xm-d-543]